MIELIRNLSETVERYKKFVKEDGESSEDITTLLAPGKIEELVREWRTPIRIGSIGSAKIGDAIEMHPYYEIPPTGFDARDIKDIFESMGVHVFVNKIGVKRWGITYTLNEEQAQQVQERINAEKLRLGRNQ